MDSDLLGGKVAFITGGAGGLGQAIAAACAEQGAAVALADLPARASELDVLTARLPRALGVHLDVRDPSTIAAAVQTTVDRLGAVDIVVCNAGLNVRKPSLEVTEADWDTVPDVNLRGVFFSAQAGAAQMVRQGRGGKIVRIASRNASSSTRNGSAVARNSSVSRPVWTSSDCSEMVSTRPSHTSCRWIAW